MNFTNKLRVLFTAIILIGMSFAASGQTKYKLVGKEIIKVSTTKAKAKPIKTDIVYKTKDTVYPVFKSKRGAYFINRKSKRSGKIYKQYLKVNK